MDEVTRIPVGGERPYDVLVGRDLLAALPGAAARRGPGGGAARAAAARRSPTRSASALRAAGVEPLPIEVPDAEAGKTHRGGRRAAGTRSARPASPVPTRWSGSAAAR